MNGVEARAFLQELYDAVCEPNAARDVTDDYFTEDFVHVTNGAIFSRTEFDDHLSALRSDLKRCRFEFTTVLAEDDRLADVHLFHATWADGHETTTKFIGVYTLLGKKISRFEEVSFLLEGQASDQDIPTRR
ncbi:MAG: nuclear transport factor 2 family protein [Myxococcota bacterium]